MSSYMKYETALFFGAVGLGMLLVLSYRLFLFIKRCFFRYTVFGSIAELIYWSLAGILLFAAGYRYNAGRIRGFLILSIGVGCFFADSLLKRLIFWGKRCRILPYRRVKRCFLGFRRSRKFEKVEKKKK